MSRRVSIFGSSFASVSYLLDDATIAASLAAGFALFRTRTGYTGRVVNARRTVGATTVVVSIGLGTANSVTLSSPVTAVVTGSTLATTLGEFVAATGHGNPDGIAANQDARIAAGFEQIGGTQVCVQATATNQPWLVTAGVLETLNGIATRRYAGNQWLSYGLPTGASKPANFSVVATVNITGVLNATKFFFGSAQISAADASIYGYAGNRGGAAGRIETIYGDGTLSRYTQANAATMTINTQQLIEVHKSSGVLGQDIYSNGALQASTGSGTGVNVGGTAFEFAEGRLGAFPTLGQHIGTVQSLFLWQANKVANRSAIVTKLNQILGTSW